MVSVMKKGERLWIKLQNAERELLSAPPNKAARLVVKIVKWRTHVFSE